MLRVSNRHCFWWIDQRSDLVQNVYKINPGVITSPIWIALLSFTHFRPYWTFILARELCPTLNKRCSVVWVTTTDEYSIVLTEPSIEYSIELIQLQPANVSWSQSPVAQVNQHSLSSIQQACKINPIIVTRPIESLPVTHSDRTGFLTIVWGNLAITVFTEVVIS